MKTSEFMALEVSKEALQSVQEASEVKQSATAFPAGDFNIVLARVDKPRNTELLVCAAVGEADQPVQFFRGSKDKICSALGLNKEQMIAAAQNKQQFGLRVNVIEPDAMAVMQWNQMSRDEQKAAEAEGRFAPARYRVFTAI